MINESGNEIEPMTKEEAEASVQEFGRMMEFFEGTCELCGRMRKDCSAECVEKHLAIFDNSDYAKCDNIISKCPECGAWLTTKSDFA